MSNRYKIALYQEAKGEPDEWRKCVEYKFVTDETEENLVRGVRDLLDEVVAETDLTSPDPRSEAASSGSLDDPVQP